MNSFNCIANPFLGLPQDLIIAKSDDKTLTVAQFCYAIGQVKEFCYRNKLRQGMCIALDMPLSLEWQLLFWGFIDSGIIVLCLNQRLPQSQKLQQAQDISANLYITDFNWQISSQSLSTEWNLNNKATIIFTSGSSGNPKPALHTLANHYYSALGSNENINLDMGDKWSLSLPLHHVGGIAILFRCLLSGAITVIGQDDNITHYSFVPTQLMDFMAKHNFKMPKAILLGGATIAESLLDKAMEYKLPIYTTYGCTEMSSQICTTSHNASLEDLKTAGQLLKYREVKISDDGEILVRGKTLFCGYLQIGGGAGVLQKSYHTQEWFCTSDYGYLDSYNRLVVLGRKDNLIISGGENICPEEIEKIILDKFGLTAIIVAVKNKRFGQRPVAFVDGVFDKDLLIKQLSAILPKYKIPDEFYTLPANNNLKISRYELAQKASKYN